VTSQFFIKEKERRREKKGGRERERERQLLQQDICEICNHGPVL